MTRFLEIFRKILRAVGFYYPTVATRQKNLTAQKSASASHKQCFFIDFAPKNIVKIFLHLAKIHRDYPL